jgi:putative flippase GtrA
MPQESFAPGLTRQAVRFVVVGLFSAVVDFGALVLLMWLGLEHTPAKAVSFVLGTATAYAVNRRWTFRAEPSARRFVYVAALYAATFLLQVGLFALLYPPLLEWLGGQTLLAQFAAFVPAQGVATVINFVVQRSLIFRAPTSSEQ